MKLTFLRTWYGLDTKLYLPLKYMATFMLFVGYGFCCFRLLPFASEIKKWIFFLQRKREKRKPFLWWRWHTVKFFGKNIADGKGFEICAWPQVQYFFQNP